MVEGELALGLGGGGPRREDPFHLAGGGWEMGKSHLHFGGQIQARHKSNESMPSGYAPQAIETKQTAVAPHLPAISEWNSTQTKISFGK